MKFRVTVKAPQEGKHETVTIAADVCNVGTVGELFLQTHEQAADGCSEFEQLFAPGVWLHVRSEPEN